MQYTGPTSKHHHVKRLLLSNREEHPAGFWSWMSRLEGQPADKKSANKFMLACILDYQMRYQIVWENARRFAEDDLMRPRRSVEPNHFNPAVDLGIGRLLQKILAASVSRRSQQGVAHRAAHR